jgi:hypothetical protein
MDNHDPQDYIPERRSEKRQSPQRYYSVQFTPLGMDSFYQFKLWNISTRGMCILVKEDSVVLKRLKVSQVIEMMYNIADSPGAGKVLKTRIIHVTRQDDGRFKGHYLVGLEILE